LATVSLALLAFSFTDLLPKVEASSQPLALLFLKTGWIALSLGLVFSAAGLLCAYVSFDIGARLYLGELLKSLGMGVPSKTTRSVSRWGKVSFRATALSLLALLIGALSLTCYTFILI
jgi:hypothetical protein